MPPVHLVHGDDDLLLHRATTDLVDRLTTEDPELSFDVHDVADLEHLPSLRTTSLFGDRTGIVVRGLEGLKADDELKDEITEYVEAPDPDAVLVLVARGTNKIRAIVNRVKKVGEIHEHKRPADWKGDAWDALVRDEFARRDVRADRTVVAALRRHAGTDTSAIASQVAQVVATLEPDATLTAEHVDDVIGGHATESTFTLVDAVVDRDVVASLVALRGLLEADDEPVMIAGALVWRFRQLLTIRAGGDHRAAGMSPGQFRRVQPLANRNFSPGELAWCQDRLARLDVDLKGGSALDAPLVLELAVLDLATPRDVGAPFNPTA
ncbi:DNA polymerase III subunit delta [Salsipaludibacter albus]|uniref:DNA polymerase III subunit delta n=1 Tax=Salsipaludibacter albus TaxID=2849650 RepID=UPI001EE44801|nr:DNA polymerase III subunit delta [Salsipaludibacter albus]MBY5162209.1 DNA polymerase III subunit delta [Salsipaludibacter albus]